MHRFDNTYFSKYHWKSGFFFSLALMTCLPKIFLVKMMKRKTERDRGSVDHFSKSFENVFRFCVANLCISGSCKL